MSKSQGCCSASKSILLLLKATLIMGACLLNLASANEKLKEIDVVYSKLISILPNHGTLMASPYADSLGSYGDKAKVTINSQSDAIGGVAFEIETTKGKNPWDAGVFNKLGAPIKKGDVIYMAFFVKATALPDGATTTMIKSAGVQQDGEPYTEIMSKDIVVTSQWESFAIAGTANADYDEQETQAAFQVATGEQTFAFGPLYIFNLGPNIDPTSLPFVNN